MYPAHIYTTQYKDTKLHQISRKQFGVPDVCQFCPSLASFRFSLRIDENVTMTQKPTGSLYNIVLVVSLCKPQ